jgi:hypothetical protein
MYWRAFGVQKDGKKNKGNDLCALSVRLLMNNGMNNGVLVVNGGLASSTDQRPADVLRSRPRGPYTVSLVPAQSDEIPQWYLHCERLAHGIGRVRGFGACADQLQVLEVHR